MSKLTFFRHLSVTKFLTHQKGELG